MHISSARLAEEEGAAAGDGERGGEMSRWAGVLYLVLMVCGPFSMMYVPSVIVVPGDAAETASRLLAAEGLFRWGILSDAVVFLTEVGLTALLYVLLEPAGRTLALAATFARLCMTVLQGMNLLPHLVALQLATEGQPGVLLMFEVHAWGVHIWEIFFGLHCLLLGMLIFRSGTFPRVLGVGMGLAAVGYSLNGLGNLLVPSGEAVYAAIVAVLALVGEVPFVLWLLLRR
jgi:hypothetical protein